MATRNELRRRSTGRVPKAVPDLGPTAGYAGNEPVQYDDETDEQFAGRVATFNASLESAKRTATPSAAHVAAVSGKAKAKPAAKPKTPAAPKKAAGSK